MGKSFKNSQNTWPAFVILPKKPFKLPSEKLRSNIDGETKKYLSKLKHPRYKSYITVLTYQCILGQPKKIDKDFKTLSIYPDRLLSHSPVTMFPIPKIEQNNKCVKLAPAGSKVVENMIASEVIVNDEEFLDEVKKLSKDDTIVGKGIPHLENCNFTVKQKDEIKKNGEITINNQNFSSSDIKSLTKHRINLLTIAAVLALTNRKISFPITVDEVGRIHFRGLLSPTHNKFFRKLILFPNSEGNFVAGKKTPVFDVRGSNLLVITLLTADIEKSKQFGIIGGNGCVEAEKSDETLKISTKEFKTFLKEIKGNTLLLQTEFIKANYSGLETHKYFSHISMFFESYLVFKTADILHKKGISVFIVHGSYLVHPDSSSSLVEAFKEACKNLLEINLIDHIPGLDVDWNKNRNLRIKKCFFGKFEVKHLLKNRTKDD